METTISKDNNSGDHYIAFFDLDHTIISTNSGGELIRYAYKKKLMSRMDLFRGIYLSVLYRFKLLNTVKIIKSMVGWLKGKSESALIRLSVEMFEDQLLKSIRPGIHERINWHKKNGGRVVILSSAILPVCKAVADHLGMDDVICTKLETSNGIFTGYIEGQLCFGKEKVTRLTEYCKTNHINPCYSWYYGDSITDLPVLSAVGNPVCVSPDKNLLKAARQRGWEVLSREITG